MGILPMSGMGILPMSDMGILPMLFFFFHHGRDAHVTT